MIKGNTQLLNEDDYLNLEASSQVRHELYNGNLIEMPGGTIFHETLILNISFFLKTFFSISDYKVFVSGLKLKVSPDKYYYPDVMLTMEYFDDIRFAKLPVFIAEVLSPNTRTFDMVDKFLDYRTLPSLQYYLLAEPEYYHVTLHFKAEDGTWQSDTYRKLTDIIKLPLMDVELPLADVYKGLKWD